MTKYIRGDLSRAASYLYHNDYSNPLRFEIYKAIEGKTHDKCIVEYDFKENKKEIDRLIHEENN